MVDNLEAMAERSSKATKAHHVFKKHYSNLGNSLGTNLSVVVSQLYSSNLISSATKDKVTSDAATPTFDKSLTLLNEVEGRVKSNEQAFEDFLNVLCCDEIDLARIAEPMRLEYQRLCEESNHSESSNLVVGNEDSRFVAPGLSLSSQVRRVEGTESLCVEKYQESRPKHLHFSELVEDRTIKQSAIQSFSQRETSGADLSVLDNVTETSLVPFGVAATTTQRSGTLAAQSGTLAECKDELKMCFSRFIEHVQEDSQKKFEEQVEYVKKDYELKYGQLKAKMERAHKDEVDSLRGTVDSLMDTVGVYAVERSAQKEKICEMEKELESIRTQFTAKSQEVKELRQTLADCEAELERVKTLMHSKQEELRQLKSGEEVPIESPTTKHQAKLQMYEHQIALCEEIQRILVQFRNCPPENIPSLKRDLKAKIEKVINTKKGRWNTL